MYEDACLPVQANRFTEIVYAHDLKSWRKFKGSVDNDDIKTSMKECQMNLHSWGRANQIKFDPGKESMHIVASDAHDNAFKILGLPFDCRLSMANAIANIVTEAAWKLRTSLRTGRHFNTSDLVKLFKSHILSFVEYRTPAMYHNSLLGES